MRLTKKKRGIYDLPTAEAKMICYYKASELFGSLQKLGQLEDVEVKLGIDLITLFKAFTQPIFYKTKDNKIEKIWLEHFVPSMKGEELHTRGKSSAIHSKNASLFISTPYTYGEKHFACKDYGKTWALTEDELK